MAGTIVGVGGATGFWVGGNAVAVAAGTAVSSFALTSTGGAVGLDGAEVGEGEDWPTFANGVRLHATETSAKNDTNRTTGLGFVFKFKKFIYNRA